MAIIAYVDTENGGPYLCPDHAPADWKDDSNENVYPITSWNEGWEEDSCEQCCYEAHKEERPAKTFGQLTGDRPWDNNVYSALWHRYTCYGEFPHALYERWRRIFGHKYQLTPPIWGRMVAR